jgi:hypothetical protein
VFNYRRKPLIQSYKELLELAIDILPIAEAEEARQWEEDGGPETLPEVDALRRFLTLH